MSEANAAGGNGEGAQSSSTPKSAAGAARENVAVSSRESQPRELDEHNPLSAEFRARVIADFERSRKNAIPAEARELTSTLLISVKDATDRVLAERIATRAMAYMEVAKQEQNNAANVSANKNVALEHTRATSTEAIDKDVARQWATADARELRRISNTHARDDASVHIANNMSRNSDYASAMNSRQKDVALIAKEAGALAQSRNTEVEMSKDTQRVVVNSIVDVSDRAPVRVTYSVGAPGKPHATYQDPQVAARVFAELEAEKRPLIVRTVRDQDGKEWSATVAGTAVVEPEGRREFVKTVAAKLDPELAAAFAEVSRDLRPRASRSSEVIHPDSRPTISTSAEPTSDREASSLQRFAAVAKELERRLIDDHFHRRGTEFRFKENADVVAFSTERTVRGMMIKTTHNDNELVVKGMVDLAVEKGWKAIEVDGTKEFKQQVWLEATARGRAVKGYEPSMDDLAKLRERLERDQPITNSIAPAVPTKRSDPADVSQRPESQLTETRSPKRADLSGEVVDLGRAPYKNLPDEPINYYIRLREKNGNETTVWGKDLERAVHETDLKVGDNVRSIRQRGREPVTVVGNVRDQDNAVVGRAPKDTHLNKWEIHKEEPIKHSLTPLQAGLVRVVTENAPSEVRELVAQRATEKLVEMQRHGVQPKVEIYDASARSIHVREPRPTPVPIRERSLNR